MTGVDPVIVTTIITMIGATTGAVSYTHLDVYKRQKLAQSECFGNHGNHG